MDLTGQTLLGKYYIEKVLGQGGMGTVWKAVHTGTGRKVAIKMLDARYAQNVSIVERFGREARAASAIEHPGIVEVLDLDRTESGTPFLVMEFLEGESLAQRIATKKKLTQQQAVDILLPLVDALAAAHERGIVHRDIKPDNVILTPKAGGGDRVTILDFGISQKADEVRSHLTQTGAVLGTPHYMPPEQALGDSNLDARADIYALGVVLYEMVVGDVPFDAPNYNALLQIILNETPAPPRERGAAIHPAFEGFILACMDKNRDHRPQTIADVRALLIKSAKGEVAVPPRASGNLGHAPKIEAADGTWGDFASLGAKPPVSPANASPRLPSPTPVSAKGKELRLDELDELPSLDFDVPVRARDVTPPQIDNAGSHNLSTEFDDPANEVRLELASDAAPAVARVGRPSPVGRISRNTPDASLRTPSKEVAEPMPKASVELATKLRELPVAFWRLLIGLVAFLVVVVVIRILVRPSELAENLSEPAPAVPTVAPGELGTAATTAEVTISGLPPEASIRLDDFPITAMPLRARIGFRHTVQISAPGYETRTMSFTPNGNLTLLANLRRAN